MKKLAIGLLGLALSLTPLVSQVHADELTLKNGHPDRYIVKKGDTLWDISNVFLETPWRWPEIWQVNPQINNPHLIYPGDTVYLTYVEGKPQLRVKRGDGSRTMKLLPDKRIEPLAQAIPSIPLDEVAAFLSESRVMDQEDLEAAPYVLAGGERRLVVGAGDSLYARGDFDEGVKVYGVYRPDGEYNDPFTGEILGYSAEDIGTVKIRAKNIINPEDLAKNKQLGQFQGFGRNRTRRVNDSLHESTENNFSYIGTFSVVRTNQEIRQEDRLLANEEREIDSIFYPTPPKNKIEGVIMSVEGGVSQIGTLDVVSINQGERDGLDVGNVLAIYKRGENIKDPVKWGSVQLPDEHAGLLIVFRTFEKMSFALVLEATRPLSILDKVRQP